MDDALRDVQAAIINGEYEKADRLLKQYVLDPEKQNAMTAILDASIGEQYGDRPRVWDAIRRGLLSDHRNYELYVMLGDHYQSENPYQSYLCYENALYYCDDMEDRNVIMQRMAWLIEQYGIKVRRAAIVILSYNSLGHTKLCLESIRMTTPEMAREIIVVDNASKDGSVEWLREQKDILLIENTENMGFPRGCNQGIEASSADTDIFLLNSDTILPVNALFWLRMGLYSAEENGLAGSVSNNARDQIGVRGIDDVSELLTFGEKNNVPMRYPYEARLTLIGFALLIKREVLDKIGVLDECFSPGNYEDTDLCLRAVKAGYRNILCRNSFIIHFGRVSFEKNQMDYLDVYLKNRKRLNDKWGFDVEYYLYPRLELLRLIKAETEQPIRVLDIGCGFGALLGRVKGLYPYAEVYGIELVPAVAEIAAHMGKVLCGDVEKDQLPWEEGYFDYIIMGDVLEHLMDPEDVLKRLRKHVKGSGHILVSMPNVKHYSVLLPLLQRDEFPYADSGILDRTHVKMYTGVEIQKLILRSGFEIEMIEGIAYDGPDEKEEAMIDVLNQFMETPCKESFLAYQYILKAKKRGI